MNVNLQAWDNFIGRSLIVFLMIEGTKTIPLVARASNGSTWFKLIENVTANVILTLLVGLTGSDIFVGACVAEPAIHPIVHLGKAIIVGKVGPNCLPGREDVRRIMIRVAETFLHRARRTDADAVAPAAGREALPVGFE